MKVPSIFELFLKKMMTLIAYVFPKLRTVKDMVRQISKNPHFRTQIHNQCAKRSISKAEI